MALMKLFEGEPGLVALRVLNLGLVVLGWLLFAGFWLLS